LTGDKIDEDGMEGMGFHNKEDIYFRKSPLAPLCQRGVILISATGEIFSLITPICLPTA